MTLSPQRPYGNAPGRSASAREQWTGEDALTSAKIDAEQRLAERKRLQPAPEPTGLRGWGRKLYQLIVG